MKAGQKIPCRIESRYFPERVRLLPVVNQRAEDPEAIDRASLAAPALLSPIVSHLSFRQVQRP